MDQLDDAELDKRIAELKIRARELTAEVIHTSQFLVRSWQFSAGWEHLEGFLKDDILASYGLSPDDRRVIYMRTLAEVMAYTDPELDAVDHAGMLPSERELLKLKFYPVARRAMQKHVEAVAAAKQADRASLAPKLVAPVAIDHPATPPMSFVQLDDGESEAAGREYATGQEYARYAKMLDALADNRPVSELTLQDFDELHEVVFSIKRGASRHIKPGVTRREYVVTDDSKLRVTGETANNYSIRLNTLHERAFRLGYTAVNPAKVMRKSLSDIRDRVKKYTSIDESEAAERAFTPDDLTKIFSGYLFNSDEPAPTHKVYPYQYWLPLLALYSGARINELAQLNTDDVVLDGMLPNFKVEADDPAKVEEPRSLKNLASKRRVPIHQYLIDLGFAEYVRERKRRKCRKLFDGLTYSRKNKWGADATQFFTRLDGKSGGYFKRVGVHLVGQDGKVFHSFRHLFISKLRNEVLLNNSNSAYIIESITGHEREEVTEADRYGTGIELDAKFEFISEIGYLIEVIPYSRFKEKFSRKLP
ncbi:site-specific integrase [Pseudomonas aeruginosa]|nr:site-specific integrase [Pseudomonas aeruginosa]HBO6091521.1 site-specific integrase [Pseudomonas aeruginosa]